MTKYPLTEVAHIRAKNNDLWMTILHIAIENQPEQTREIISKIIKNDKEVTEWLSKL
jgi:hypothetical protein